jgi:hypothetical protein
MQGSSRVVIIADIFPGLFLQHISSASRVSGDDLTNRGRSRRAATNIRQHERIRCQFGCVVSRRLSCCCGAVRKRWRAAEVSRRSRGILVQVSGRCS